MNEKKKRSMRLTGCDLPEQGGFLGKRISPSWINEYIGIPEEKLKDLKDFKKKSQK
ncbi:MAG: hypothetical protein ACTSP9_08000 [Promethearchaeota archaeon]